MTAVLFLQCECLLLEISLLRWGPKCFYFSHVYAEKAVQNSLGSDICIPLSAGGLVHFTAFEPERQISP